MTQWKFITEARLIEQLNTALGDAGLPAWPADGLSRDLLASYLEKAGRPFVCMGPPPFSAVSEEDARKEYEGTTPWNEIGGPVMDHVRNRPVFRRYVDIHAQAGATPFLLWFDGQLGKDTHEPTCFEVPVNEWMTFEAAMTKDHPFWYSFDQDKILFAPNAESALIAFHHDCFEVAGIRGDPEFVWGEMGFTWRRGAPSGAGFD